MIIRAGSKFISLKGEESLPPSDCDRISLWKCEMYGIWVNALGKAKTLTKMYMRLHRDSETTQQQHVRGWLVTCRTGHKRHS